MPTKPLPDEQRRAKERMEELRGFWSAIFDELLFLRPEFVVRYAELSAHPGEVLDRKTKELLHVAVDCSTTHLYHRGTRSHINNAFDHGATLDEIIDVFVLTSSIGLHTSAMGAALLDELADDDADDADADEEAEETFREQLGYWSAETAALARRDGAHLEHYRRLTNLPAEVGALDARTRDFVLLAVEIAPTRMNREAARVHAENALEHGATPEEVMAVVETASVIGVHTMDSMAILVEEAARRGLLPEELTDHEEYVTFRDPRYL